MLNKMMTKYLAWTRFENFVNHVKSKMILTLPEYSYLNTYLYPNLSLPLSFSLPTTQPVHSLPLHVSH